MKTKTRMQIVASLFHLSIIPSGIALATTDTWFTNGDGTVTDVATGLIWQQEDDDIRRTNANAMTYCQNLTLANNSNWRLPNAKELASIVDFRRENPAIDRAAFPNTNPTRYWTATSNPNSSNSAWYVTFGSGIVISEEKVSLNFVRCVR